MSSTFNPRKIFSFAVIAGLINSAVFLIAKSADATMIVKQGALKEITLPIVLLASIFGLILAAYLLQIIGKKFQSLLINAPLVGLFFGVVTAVAPFTATDDSKTAFSLALNHIVAGIVWFFGSKKALK